MKNEKICKNCGFTGVMKKKSKGYLWLELVFWAVGILFFVILLIAIPYSLYRLFSNKYNICPKCGNTNIIPVHSPVAKEILRKTVG